MRWRAVVGVGILLVPLAAPAAAQKKTAVGEAACRWGDALATTLYMDELCPRLALTPLAVDMARTFVDHPRFRRCYEQGVRRMVARRPSTDADVMLYCVFLLGQTGRGGAPVVAPRPD